MFTISFVVTSLIEILQTVGFIRKAFDEISRQDVKLKHSKMQEKHLIKIVTLLWRVSTKIMKQSLSLIKQTLNKPATVQKGWHFLVISRKIDTGLPALVVALFSNGSKCSDTSRMPCKISWIAFLGVWVLFLPFRPRPLNWAQLRFVVCVKKVSCF